MSFSEMLARSAQNNPMTLQEANRDGHSNIIMLYLRSVPTRCNASYQAKLISDLTKRHPQYQTLTGTLKLKGAIDALVNARILERISGVNTSTGQTIAVLRIPPVAGGRR